MMGSFNVLTFQLRSFPRVCLSLKSSSKLFDLIDFVAESYV